jgi:hypothetical protein
MDFPESIFLIRQGLISKKETLMEGSLLSKASSATADDPVVVLNRRPNVGR